MEIGNLKLNERLFIVVAQDQLSATVCTKEELHGLLENDEILNNANILEVQLKKKLYVESVLTLKVGDGPKVKNT